LAKAGKNLPKSLEILLTYPFPDSVLDAIKGDYFNVFIETNFRTPADCDEKGCEWPQPDNSPDYQTFSGDSGGDRPDNNETRSKRAPMMLPPTSSPAPGMREPTMPVPPENQPDQVPDHVPGTQPDGASPEPGSGN